MCEWGYAHVREHEDHVSVTRRRRSRGSDKTPWGGLFSGEQASELLRLLGCQSWSRSLLSPLSLAFISEKNPRLKVG